jgi:hypothetical protein
MTMIFILLISLMLTVCSASISLFSGIDNLLKPQPHYLRKERVPLKPAGGSLDAGYLKVQRFSDDRCSNGALVGQQFFKISTCSSLPHGQYFAKFITANEGSSNSKLNLGLEIQVFRDSSCHVPLGVPSTSNFPMNQCRERTLLSVVKEVTPSTEKEIIVTTYNSQASCKTNALTSESLIQVNTFQPGVCNEGQLGDFMVDSCNPDGSVVKGLSFLSTDGSCSGISSRFSFPSSQSCSSDDIKITDVGFFRFSGFSNFICSVVIPDSSVYPSSLVM